ncbi:chemotaxis protein CheW [Bacillus carboniphilus]|uniref:Chemotaxis protein CheW n=1 Tax=Bacillus carboniphilus TaxID=86663 RepID=A0ABY9JVV0_9BACI|nr:chemotaxis protein CheW [Bacillus carboniphilus]WLR43521.1 chemotaxis protein CheW [Bacillus carboniphilus]
MSNRLKYIHFKLSDQDYAVDVKDVLSIEKILPITRVPGTPDFIEGVTNLRGVITPVIHLGTKLGFSKGVLTDATRIIILNNDQYSIGMIVDEAKDVFEVSEENIEKSTSVVGSIEEPFIKGVTKMDDKIIMVMDTLHLLGIRG